MWEGGFFPEEEAAGGDGVVEWYGAHGEGVVFIDGLGFPAFGEWMEAYFVGGVSCEDAELVEEEVFEFGMSIDVEGCCSSHEGEGCCESEEPEEVVAVEV